MRTHPYVLALLIAGAVSVAAQQTLAIDPATSKFTIHVDKTGFFSVAGDKHEIEAPIASGTIDEKAKTVTLKVEAAKLKALDPQLSADKRAEVQKKMEAEVLEVTKYPEISFLSTEVTSDKIGHWNVKGELRLHGQAHPVTVSVTEPSTELALGKPPAVRHFNGTATLKQTDFGIKPITIAGGAVKVKDELKLEFQITAAERNK